ncbi:MAG: S-adenosylmethionine:tRNA ribosyltransferase-isomerase, partial [Thermoleophilaceae bacterium]
DPVPAREPPEARGLERDEVAMLVASRSAGTIAHARFHDLPGFLDPGDLLVVNVSATLPAALDARLGDREVELHLSTPAAGGAWVVELRTREGGPFGRPPIGARLRLPGGAHADLLAPFAGGKRLCVARLGLGEPVERYLVRHGRPIAYDYARGHWPIDAYQTVFAREPGSAEMPSAARPFTTDLVTELVTRGVLLAPVTLHTGVSSPERGEPPYPERYDVPAATANIVNAVRGWGGRVIAAGTTVVRALETAATDGGTVSPAAGWTGLVVTPERGLRAVDGLLTGWHDADSSHLQLIEAVAGPELLARCYREAVERGYRFHEFGDSHLLLP